MSEKSPVVAQQPRTEKNLSRRQLLKTALGLGATAALQPILKSDREPTPAVLRSELLAQFSFPQDIAQAAAPDVFVAVPGPSQLEHKQYANHLRYQELLATHITDPLETLQPVAPNCIHELPSDREHAQFPLAVTDAITSERPAVVYLKTGLRETGSILKRLRDLFSPDKCVVIITTDAAVLPAVATHSEETARAARFYRVDPEFIPHFESQVGTLDAAMKDAITRREAHVYFHIFGVSEAVPDIYLYKPKTEESL